MTSKFAIVYAKYSMAINTDTVDNKLRDEFCKLFNEEPENEKDRLVSLIINMIFDHYKIDDRLDLAKEECLKLDFGKYLPNKTTFGLVLDLLSVHRNDDCETQINAIKDVVLFIKERDQYLDYFYKGIFNLMLQRLLTIDDENRTQGVNLDPDLALEVISGLENLDDVEYGLELIIWYC